MIMRTFSVTVRTVSAQRTISRAMHSAGESDGWESSTKESFS